MRTLRWIGAVTVAGLLAAGGAPAQEFQVPKPGPEHEYFKKLVGSWEATAKAGPTESKGNMVYTLDPAGLWLLGKYEGDFGGQTFYGYGMDSYDPGTKKYVGVWVDSMMTRPLNLEGTFDKDKKVMTMSGEGPGMDGKPTRYKNVSEWKDGDTIVFTMYQGDAKEPGVTITFKRKK
jgi:Protein of unknown function (DUF1579)